MGREPDPAALPGAGPAGGLPAVAAVDRCQREGDPPEALALRGVPDYRVPAEGAAGGGGGSGGAEGDGGEDAEWLNSPAAAFIINMNESDYLKEIESRLAEGSLTPELRNRFELAEGRGIVGWKKDPAALSLLIWDLIPRKETIAIADKLAIEFGQPEAFFELYEVAFGGAGDWFVTWILEKAVEWAAGKGFEWIFNKIQSKAFLQLSNDLKETVDLQNQDGKLYIRIRNVRDIKEVVIEIVGHPTVTNEITVQNIAELKKLIESTDESNYIYSRSGMKFTPGSCGSKLISRWV
jgi:hypothetical protein